jgi:hypothetical protein
MEEAKTFIDDNLKKGYIRKSSSPMASPLFFVGKKDGKLWPCQDYQYLNHHTVKNAYPLPLIANIMDKLKGAKYFTKLDVRLGYNNIRIRDGDQWKAAFSTPFGLFEPMVMFFGMTNSPATFQDMINTIFVELIDGNWIIIYMDDILIYVTTIEELDQRTRSVLQTLHKHDLYLKAEKCEFEKTRLEYLGFIITPDQVEMDPGKLKGITDWPTPKSIWDIQKFIGFSNYYRRFIHRYADITRPLNNLLSKNRKFEWNDDADKSFKGLKEIFTKQPVLIMPDQQKAFEVECDASKYASGAVLYQNDINGNRHPVQFYSKSFSPAERNYEIYNRELLAIVRALEEWRHYLEGSKFQTIIRSDHRNLGYWKKPQKVSRRQARWKLFLTRFDFRIDHVAGSKLPAADALSRQPDHMGDTNNDNEDVTMLNEVTFPCSTHFILRVYFGISSIFGT